MTAAPERVHVFGEGEVWHPGHAENKLLSPAADHSRVPRIGDGSRAGHDLKRPQGLCWEWPLGVRPQTDESIRPSMCFELPAAGAEIGTMPMGAPLVKPQNVLSTCH